MTMDVQETAAAGPRALARKLPPADLSVLERPSDPDAVPQWVRTMATFVSVVQGVPLFVMMASLFVIGMQSNNLVPAFVAISFFVIPAGLAAAQCIAALRHGRRRLLISSGLLAALDGLGVIANIDRLGSGLFAVVMLLAAAQLIVFLGVLLSK